MTKVQKVLAQNIRFYRKQKRLTQEQLAEKAGTATNYIGTIEIGRKFPSPKMIEKIAAALEIDELTLFSCGPYGLAQNSMNELEKTLILNLTQTVQKTFCAAAAL